MSSPSPWISSTSNETFEQDVLQRSENVLVVVDFWATWCQPCLMLMPVMEKVVGEYDGRFELVKVDIDQMQPIAQSFGIASVPTVLAFYGGQPIDGFQGLVPEAQLKEWVDRLLVSVEVEQAREMETSDPAGAEARYRRALELEPKETSLLTGLGRALLAQDRTDEVKAIVEQLEADEVSDSELETLKAQLELADHEGEDLQPLRDAVASAPDDREAQLRLAEGLASNSQQEEALQICLELVETEPQGVGKQAQHLMLDIFRVLPDTSDLVKTYRSKLTALLF